MNIQEEFEKWALSEGLDILKYEGDEHYISDTTQGYFCVWKASRESLVIELPFVRDTGGYYNEFEYFDVDEVKESLANRGLKYK